MSNIQYGVISYCSDRPQNRFSPDRVRLDNQTWIRSAYSVCVLCISRDERTGLDAMPDGSEI